MRKFVPPSQQKKLRRGVLSGRVVVPLPVLLCLYADHPTSLLFICRACRGDRWAGSFVRFCAELRCSSTCICLANFRRRSILRVCCPSQPASMSTRTLALYRYSRRLPPVRMSAADLEQILLENGTRHGLLILWHTTTCDRTSLGKQKLSEQAHDALRQMKPIPQLSANTDVLFKEVQCKVLVSLAP